MTIIGAIPGPNSFLWADTEFYHRLDDDESPHLRGRPIGHHLKLAINERTCVAAVGCGDNGGNIRISKAVHSAVSFDHLCMDLPDFLRAAAQYRKDCEIHPMETTCAAVGWSHRLGRMTGVVFDYRTRFALSYTAGFSAPHLPEFLSMHPNDPFDILGYAQAQMRLLRRTYPLAGTGTVTIAQLRRSGVNVTSFDLVTCRASMGLPKIPAMGTYFDEASA